MGEGSWILKGRRDDMLILASGGLNVSAVEVESAVKKEGEGLVRAAMLVGHGREKTGLLVEVREDVDRENLHDAMGRIVQRVNKGLREKARVSSDMVMTLEKGMELPVGVKGNIKRKEAHDRYQAEIGALYSG